MLGNGRLLSPNSSYSTREFLDPEHNSQHPFLLGVVVLLAPPVTGTVNAPNDW
jgi:hypothetical protein